MRWCFNAQVSFPSTWALVVWNFFCPFNAAEGGKLRRVNFRRTYWSIPISIWHMWYYSEAVVLQGKEQGTWRDDWQSPVGLKLYSLRRYSAFLLGEKNTNNEVTLKSRPQDSKHKVIFLSEINSFVSSYGKHVIYRVVLFFSLHFIQFASIKNEN